MNWIIRALGMTPVASAPIWTKKWTTLLSALQAAFIAVIALWFTFPDRAKDLVPDWVIIAVIVGAALTTFATVVAANVLQSKLVVPVKYDPLQKLPGD